MEVNGNNQSQFNERNKMKTKITDYYIDDNKTLHTYIGSYKHITISDVKNDKQAKELIEELQAELRDRENMDIGIKKQVGDIINETKGIK